MLHAGPQDLLCEGQRARGQVPEGGGARERPARGGDAGEAVLPDRGRGREVRVRQGVHRPLLRRDRPSLREGGAQHHDPHEQHGAELLGRVPRGGRGPALCARQGIRQGIGLHDARPELPRPRARHLLGRGGAAGDEGQGDAAQGSVATT